MHAAPASIFACNGQSTFAVTVLVAAVFAREQLRAGAIGLDDATVATLLGLDDKRKATAATKKLTKAGIIEPISGETGLYRMPDATPNGKKTPADFDPRKALRLRWLGLDGETYEVLTSDDAWNELWRLIH